MRNLIISTILIFLIQFSCKSIDDENTKNLPVRIYETEFPSSASLNQPFDILTKAQATNGCFTKLEIQLIEKDNHHLLIKGTGEYWSNGICPTVMVYEDSIINFTPTSVGNYHFQINEEPFDVDHVIVVVN